MIHFTRKCLKRKLNSDDDEVTDNQDKNEDESQKDEKKEGLSAEKANELWSSFLNDVKSADQQIKQKDVQKPKEELVKPAIQQPVVTKPVTK